MYQVFPLPQNLENHHPLFLPSQPIFPKQFSSSQETVRCRLLPSLFPKFFLLDYLSLHQIPLHGQPTGRQPPRGCPHSFGIPLYTPCHAHLQFHHTNLPTPQINQEIPCPFISLSES